MKRNGDYYQKPLDWIFSTPTAIRILRALRNTRQGLTGRGVAREAGVNHEACRMALDRLESIGVVSMAASGRTRLFTLNKGNALVQDALLPLLESERRVVRRLHDEIRKFAKRKALSATIFGSAARKEAREESDLDLFFIVSDAKQKDAFETAFYEFRSKTLDRFGAKLSPIVLTLREALSYRKKKNPLLANVLADGIDIGDRAVKEILK